MARKTYLVVTAMQEELDGLLHGHDFKSIGEHAFLIQEENFVVYAILGGIGKVGMTFQLASFVSNIHIDEIINIGVAGTISPKLKPLQTLIASCCAYHDVDVTAFGYSKGQMCSQPLYYSCDPRGIELAMKMNPTDHVSGLILSGDSFITKKNLPSSFYEDFKDPIACDMESAAVGQVANMLQVPFMIIRTISDDPSSSSTNTQDYEKRLHEASLKAGEVAYQLMERLSL